MSSPEEIVKILSGKTPVDIRDAKIAHKCYPDFDSFDVNRKVAIRM